MSADRPPSGGVSMPVVGIICGGKGFAVAIFSSMLVEGLLALLSHRLLPADIDRLKVHVLCQIRATCRFIYSYDRRTVYTVNVENW